MRRLRAMIGMPVVCRGHRLGRMVQAELSSDLGRLKGIWVSAGLRGTRYIPAESLEMIGQVAIQADDPGRRARGTARSLFCRAISTDGRRLGAITGAEIDEVSFAVRALELSKGFWDDLVNERERVQSFFANRETGEIVVDPAEHPKEVDKHEGRNDEGPDHGNAARRSSGDDIRRQELEDGAKLEPDGPADGQLDLQKGR